MSDVPATLASFEMAAPRDPAHVATVRRFVGDLCGRALSAPTITSRILVATHELLDNAVRYASRDACMIRLDVTCVGRDVAVRIATRNPVNDDRSRALAAAIGPVEATADPVAFYRTLLARAASGVEGVGLGLGRVQAEADLRIHHLFEGGEVVIRAEGRFPLDAA